MISKKALVLGLVGLVFVAGGTASVLESFGTVSGTADVQSAVEITNVDSSAETVELTKNTEEDIVAEYNVEIFNATSDSSGESIRDNDETDIEMTGDSDQTESYDVNLSGVDEVGLEIDDTVVDDKVVDEVNNQ